MPVFIKYPDEDSLINVKNISRITRYMLGVTITLNDGQEVRKSYSTEEDAIEGLKTVQQMIRQALLYSNPFPSYEGDDPLFLTFKLPEIKYRKLADIPDLEINDKGDWIDLYTAETVQLETGEFMKIRLGVAMELPEGYEAVVVPRSSTFGKYGVVQTNSMGVIDESYKGDGDEWSMPVFATRDVLIPKHTRLCQFRIQEHQPHLMFSVVEHLGNADRGGYGTTGD